MKKFFCKYWDCLLIALLLPVGCFICQFTDSHKMFYFFVGHLVSTVSYFGFLLKSCISDNSGKSSGSPDDK